MRKVKDYLNQSDTDPVSAIVAGIDRDVEYGEDILMLGLGIVMLSSTFAPIAPPHVLLPLVALTFAVTSSLARWNYHAMENKLRTALAQLEQADIVFLHPIVSVFVEQPMPPLAESYNLLKNRKRTLKSLLGGILINPLWMPIFYVMGIQIIEEKNLSILNKAIIGVEQKLYRYNQIER